MSYAQAFSLQMELTPVEDERKHKYKINEKKSSNSGKNTDKLNAIHQINSNYRPKKIRRRKIEIKRTFQRVTQKKNKRINLIKKNEILTIKYI